MKTAQDFRTEIPVLKKTDLMTRARQILRDDRFREIYVVDARNRLLGYIDITDGLRVTATRSNVTVEGFIKEAAQAGPDDPIERVARRMKDYRTDSAAVVDANGQVTGGVLLSDLFPVIISRNELQGTVSALMSPDIVSAEPEDPIQKVYTMIMESGFSAFPVLKKKKLVGVISRRDLISTRKVRAAIARHANRTVGDVMSKDPVTTGPDVPIREAAELLVRHDVSLIPVLDHDRPVGVVNRHDVLAGLV